MASVRTLQVQGLVSNGQSIGGLATLSFMAAHRDVVVARGEGAYGAEDVDRAGLSVSVHLTCGDVKKAAALLDATPADTSFSTKESGATTFHDYTITAATDGTIVWTGMRISIPKPAYAALSVDGLIRFAAGTKKWEDILALTAGQAAPTLVSPSRLMRAHNFSFNPGTPITLAKMLGIELNLAAEEVFEDFGEDDVGMTDVDRGPWRDLQVTATHGDATAVAPSHKNAALLSAGRGVLTCDLMGAADGTEQILTINNLLWTGAPQNEQAGYTEFQIAGSCGWKNGATLYDLTGQGTYTELFTIANKT